MKSEASQRVAAEEEKSAPTLPDASSGTSASERAALEEVERKSVRSDSSSDSASAACAFSRRSAALCVNKPVAKVNSSSFSTPSEAGSRKRSTSP